MTKTRPWALFMGVIMLLACGLMVLVAIGMLLMGAMVGDASELGPVGGAALGVVYLVLALVYVIPGVRLLQFAAAIKRLPDTPALALEQAVRHQLAFWRYVGIVTIACIVAYLLIIAAAIAFGVLSGK